MTPKCASEALRRAEANRQGSFRHARILNQKQLPRHFHPQTQYRPGNGFVRQPSPNPMEVKWGDRSSGSELR
jgi:hypothetical protein